MSNSNSNDKDKSPNQSPFLTSTNLTTIIPPQIPLPNQSLASTSINSSITSPNPRFSPRLLNPNANPFEFRPTSPPSIVTNPNPNNIIPSFNSLNPPSTSTTTTTSSNTSINQQDPPILTTQQKAQIIRKHLLTAEDQQKALITESLTNTTSSSPRTTSHWASTSALDTRNNNLALESGGTAAITSEEEYPTPYGLQGGDIVAPIYKWVQQQQSSGSFIPGSYIDSTTGLRRSRSLISLPDALQVTGGGGSGSRRVSSNSKVDQSGFTFSDRGEQDDEMEVLEDGVEEEFENDGLKVKEILEPGGFRRDFVIRRMVSRGDLPPSSSNSDPTSSTLNLNNYGTNNNNNETSSNKYRRGNGNSTRLTRSFIDFLSLYGHFGGEDLEEIEEDDEEGNSDDLEEGDLVDEEDLWDEDNRIPAYRGVRKDLVGISSEENLTHERTSLLRQQSTRKSPITDSHLRSQSHSRQHSRKRSSSVGQHGDATVTQAVLMLLKSFVGTGVLFLGKAFYNGGILFSTIVLCGIAMVSLYSFLLLVETRLVVHGSFGDIGGILYGKYMRWMILFSIVLSQIGFVAAYTIFVAQNLQAFFMAVTKCATFIPIAYLILGQLIIFLPLAMIRNIQKLSGTALIADAFILFGLIYIFSNEIGVLFENGLADIEYFNSKDFPLLIGTAVFSFEGIGLVIPITESMKDPHQFPRVLTGVMVGVMFLFAGAGILAYAAYGSAIQTVVFVNLPQDDKFVNAAQFLYSIAILLSTPLQLFPAVRIMENGLFGISKSGKFSTKIKWEKNLFRGAVVVGSAFVAWAGASDLDKFVSLIGSVACVPLCFCYPALLHYRACATTRKQKIADILLFIFGCLAAVYTTAQTIKLLTNGESSAPPSFGGCPGRG